MVLLDNNIAYDNFILDYIGVSIKVRLRANFFVLLASLISPFRERKNSSGNL